MSLEAVNNPQITSRKESSVEIDWTNVFPPIKDNTHLLRGLKQTNPSQISPSNERIYDLRIQDDFDEWRVVYWGRKTSTTVYNLHPCRCYNFKIKLIHTECGNNTKNSENFESNWLQFKAATTTDHHHVHHLTRAIKQEKTALIRRMILSRPYLLETPNVEDKSPLLQATEAASLHLVQFLTSLGADVNAQANCTKRTALMLALFYGCTEIARFLIEKHAKINLRDINDRTALHYAIDGDNLEAVKFAVCHGADVESRDDQGWTPLLRAVILENQDAIIKVLMKRNVDCDVTDNRGLGIREHLQLTNRKALLVQYNKLG